MARLKARPLFDPPIVRRASLEALRKLDPRVQLRNPVMFVVLVTAVLTTVLGIEALRGHGEAPAGLILAVSVWLWFTVVFANFAEAMAEGRGKAQAEALRRARGEVFAKKLADPADRMSISVVPAPMLRKGDAVVVVAGDVIPCDGEILEDRCESTDVVEQLTPSLLHGLRVGVNRTDVRLRLGPPRRELFL